MKPYTSNSQLHTPHPREREFFVDNLLVQIHLIIEMISEDQPCAMEFISPFPGLLVSHPTERERDW
jgi:hypothetical protein